MKLNIRNKLILFAALLIFAPLALSALAFVVIVRGNIEADAQRTVEKDARLAEEILKNRQRVLVEIAQATAQSIAKDNLIDSAATPTSATSSSGNASQAAQASQQGGQRQLQQVLKQRSESSGVDFIAVINTKGDILIRQNGSASGETVADNPLFIKSKNAIESNQPDAIEKATSGGALNETDEFLKRFGLDEQLKKTTAVKVGLTLEGIAPITSGNKALGYVLVGQLANNAPQDENRPLTALTRQIKQTLYRDLQDASVTAILMKDKTVVSASDPRAVGAKIQSELASDKPTAVSNNLLGDSFKTAFAPVKAPDDSLVGYIGVGVKDSYFNSVLYTSLLIIAVTTLVFLAVGVGFAVFLSQQLTQPITQLTEAANRISLGELDDPIAVASKDEIGQLGESLERMRISLKQAIERLRSRR
jgi:methyl-accepting chemotaxis protein